MAIEFSRFTLHNCDIKVDDHNWRMHEISVTFSSLLAEGVLVSIQLSEMRISNANKRTTKHQDPPFLCENQHLKHSLRASNFHR